MAKQAEAARQTVYTAIEECATDPAGFVRDYPVTTMMVVFSAGIGLGLLACSAIAESVAPPETMAQRWSRQLNDAVGEIKSTVQRGIKSAY